jgi:hypothetical protein
MGNECQQKDGDPGHQMDFVSARWWQMIPFLRLNFELVRNIDPLAERIASRPWALSSLLEYAYMAGTYLRSITHFVTVSGERAGVVWTYYRARIGFILMVGVVRRFLKPGMGLGMVDFIEDYVRRLGGDALVAVMAVRNRAVRWMAREAGGRPLGLATARLRLSKSLSAIPVTGIDLRRMKRSEAARAWKRWRLHEVEHVAGADGIEIAARLLDSYTWLEPLPRGRHVGLSVDGQEIGSAHIQRHRDGLCLHLFTSQAFWSGRHTANLVAAIAAHTGSVVDHLIVTRTHALTLDTDASFEFEREKDKERVYAFKLL